MSSLYETNSFASEYQWLSMFFVYKVLNFGSVNTFMDSCNDGIVDYWVSSKFFSCCSYEALFQHNQFENVYALHQHIEFVFWHDFAVFTSSLVHTFNCGVNPWLIVFSQFIWMHVADVSLVWQVSQSLFVCSDVVWQFFEVLRTWVYDSLSCLSCTIFHYHVWCMGKDIACAFDYTVHCSHASHSLIYESFFIGYFPIPTILSCPQTLDKTLERCQKDGNSHRISIHYFLLIVMGVYVFFLFYTRKFAKNV